MHLNKGMKTTFGWGDQRGNRKEPTRVFRIEYIRLLIVVLPKNDFSAILNMDLGNDVTCMYPELFCSASRMDVRVILMIFL